MSLDPHADLARLQRGAAVALAMQVAELRRDVDALKRTAVPVDAVAPSGAGRDGALVGESGTPRLWLRVGGAWRYVTLT